MPTPAVDVPGVLKRYDPEGDALPLMFGSPHSGHVYPDDFAHSCPRDMILWGEDAFVDKLFAYPGARRVVPNLPVSPYLH
jgi:N-formylglutamate amidohydrolase